MVDLEIIENDQIIWAASVSKNLIFMKSILGYC